jgi:CRISPR-associated protein Cmr1
MARKISDELNAFVNELKVEPIADENIIKQIRQYKLITPLFGGGAETKKADAVKIIRETEIRGQLRFWWRAIRGVGEIKEMLQRESEIFGTSASESGDKKLGQSKVKVFVKIENEGEPSEPFFIKNGRFSRPVKEWEKIAYVSFPLQLTSDEIKKNFALNEIISDIEFTLEISFPTDKRIDVEASLWAWETFGGIGGRTRRGFGSVELLKLTENGEDKSLEVKDEIGKVIRREKSSSSGLADFKTFINDNITDFTKDLAGKNFDKNVPHISISSDFKTQSRNKSQEAWEFLIGKLKDFRQARPMERVGDRIDYGQSHWSEPDAIRHFYIKENPEKEKSLGHKPKKAFDDIENVNKFPRAVFGLPIIFHFMDKEELPDTELKPSEHERLSSPLILKPVACEDGKFIALALVMETPKLSFDDIHLFASKNGFDIGKVETDLTDNEAKTLTKNGLTLLKNEKDVLKAFLETI